MSTYEIDDRLVANIVEGHWAPETTMAKLAAVFELQLPLPVPTKLAAVVQTAMDVRGPRTFVRTCTDGHSANPWQQINAPDEPSLPTEQIGRIVEVLSEGVDL